MISSEQIIALNEFMKKEELSQKAMGIKLEITRQYLNLILNGNKPITAKLALKLESVTYHSFHFWLGELSKPENVIDDKNIVTHWKKTGYRMLVDHEIKTAVKNNYIKIKPFESKNLEPTSYCLTIGNTILLSHEKQPVTLTPEDPTIILQPGNKALLKTREFLDIPRNITAQLSPTTEIIDKIISLKSGEKVHPGYKGIIYFILTNHTQSSIPIGLGSKIIRIVFIFLPVTPEKIYSGKNQGLNDFPKDLKESFYKNENNIIDSI